MAWFRSYLFAPGNNEKLLGKALGAGADAVVFDLEDAVPETEKAKARELVSERIEGLDASGSAVYVRINAVSSNHWADDLDAVIHPALRGIRLPKVETHSDLETVMTRLSALSETRGIERSPEIFATIESAKGVHNVSAIAGFDGVCNLCFGEADFVADIGAEPGGDELQTLYARSRIVLASRAAEIDPPVAAVFTAYRDLGGLRESTLAARRLGFFGRSVIHPMQLETVHAVFTPDEASLDKALEQLRIYEEGLARGSGGGSTADGGFVDLAVVRRARAIVRLAERYGSESDTREDGSPE